MYIYICTQLYLGSAEGDFKQRVYNHTECHSTTRTAPQTQHFPNILGKKRGSSRSCYY